MEVSADALTRTRFCCVPNCPNEARGGRGLAAYCGFHAELRKQELAEARRQSAIERGRGPYASRVRRLEGLADDLDLSIARAGKAVLEVESRRSLYRAALRALAQAEGVL